MERNFKNQNELEQDFAQEGCKYWNMLAQHVVFRESTLVNKQQAFLKKQSMANKQAAQKRELEEKSLSDRKKLRANVKQEQKEDLNKDMISSDEMKFQQTKMDLQKKIVAYYQDMERKGHLTQAEKRFLKQGVVFQTLKLSLFGFRPQDLRDRELLILKGKIHLISRPGSGLSSKRSDQGVVVKKKAQKSIPVSTSKEPPVQEEGLGKSKIATPEQSFTGSPPPTMVLDLTRQRVRIKKNDQVLSPVRKYIMESTEREKEFNLASITKWTVETVRRYNKYIRQFENYHTLFNLMVMDRLMQDLEEYYKAIRQIRDKEDSFQKCLDNIRQS